MVCYARREPNPRIRVRLLSRSGLCRKIGTPKGGVTIGWIVAMLNKVRLLVISITATPE